MLQFRGSVVTSDAGLLAYRELDAALGLTTMAGEILADARTGKNGRHALVGMLRQSVFGRLAEYEDVNDAERLRHDPAMSWIVGGKAALGAAASPSQMGRFETRWLTAERTFRRSESLRRRPRGACWHRFLDDLLQFSTPPSGDRTARRTRTTATAMFAWGGEHGLVSGNPFAAMKVASAPVRKRFLTEEEAGNLLHAISDRQEEAACSGTFADALRLLLLTGARKTEILGLRWTEIDNARKLLILPPVRTKAGGKTGERRIPLSAPALEILTRRHAKAEEAWHNEAEGELRTSEFVFPAGPGPGPRDRAARVCTKANLSGLRIHDLRHSFASFAIADGASLFLIGKLLGHASARTP
jgi:integrase